MQRYNNDNRMNTGRPWVNLLSRALSHLVIIIVCVFLVLLACDFFLRGEMSFIANPDSKILLLVLCVLAGINSLIQLRCLYRLRALRKYITLRSKLRKKSRS